jgi:hypothetical protein
MAPDPLVLPEDEFALVRRIWVLLEATEGDGSDEDVNACVH